jgi:hypothetical protein
MLTYPHQFLLLLLAVVAVDVVMVPQTIILTVMTFSLESSHDEGVTKWRNFNLTSIVMVPPKRLILAPPVEVPWSLEKSQRKGALKVIML